MNSQKSLGHDQYPKVLSEANNVLSNHRFDANATTKQEKLDKLQKQKQSDRDRQRNKEKHEDKIRLDKYHS